MTNSSVQVQLVIESLRPGVVDLIRDLNGNHVIQRCLQRLGPEESQFVYDAAQENTREIATHRHGCCVLQRCIDFATQEQREALVNKVLDNALSLSQVCPSFPSVTQICEILLTGPLCGSALIITNAFMKKRLVLCQTRKETS